MTALIIHESFVKQRQQTLPRCDLFNVTISFLFLCFVLTSSSIIFRKHPIPFLGHAKTCFLALPARWIKKKLARALPKVFHTQRCLWPLEMSVFLLNDNYATRGPGRGIKLQTLWPIGTLCVFCFYAWVSGWKGKKQKENQNQSSSVKCHGCVWEKAEYRDFNLILRSYRILMSTRPSKRIAGTCCHCTLPARLGLRHRLLDQDDTCGL